MEWEQLRELTQKVSQWSEKVDGVTHRYATRFNVGCKLGCTKCCDNPKISVLPLSLLPWAMDHWEKSQFNVEEALKSFENRSEEHSSSSLCVFYNPKGSLGGCSIYSTRPSLCRFFGFFSRLNKYGQHEHVACRIQQEELNLTKVNQSLNEIQGESHRFLVQQLEQELKDLWPVWAKEELPLNEAFKVALGWVVQSSLHLEHPVNSPH